MNGLKRDSDEYKNLNSLRSDQIKTFHAICKIPVEEKPKVEDENKDGFK
jgi:hypothetical protein